MACIPGDDRSDDSAHLRRARRIVPATADRARIRAARIASHPRSRRGRCRTDRKTQGSD